MNIQCRPEQETELYVSIDAEDLERVGVKEWTMRTGDGSSRIVCLANKSSISLDRFIACSHRRRHVSHLNGDRLDYRKSNLYPTFPAPPPNEWGNYFPALGRRSTPAPPPPLIPPPDYRSYAQFYGPKWKEVQAAAMARAHGKCEKCKRRKARHVHHILLVRYFLDPEEAHYLENTLAVCLRCHHEEHRQAKHRFPLFDGLKYKFV